MSASAAELRQFPEGIWAATGTSAAPLEDQLRRLLAWTGRFHSAPRDFGLAVRHCLETLPGGRMVLAGAGTHSRRLIPELSRRPDIRIVAVADRLAGAMAEFEGIPVVAASAAAALDADYVLVAHTSYELEMRAALLAAGFPADRIVTLYSDPRYRERAVPVARRLAEAAVLRSADFVVVNCCPAAIVPDELLAGAFPPDRTVELFVGRADGFEPSPVYETVDLLESMDALRLALLSLRPKAIYIRTILYKNFIPALVKHWLPDARVIAEPYDFAVLWSEGDLELLFGLSPETIALTRSAEFVAGRTVDLILSKRGGDHWDRVVRPWTAGSVLYFPAVADAGDADGRRGDLVYAGFLPAEAFLKTFQSGYSFVPVMREVCARGDLRGEIYNSADTGPAGPSIFRSYRESMAQGPLRYHGRLPYPEMLERLRGFRYGWLCDALGNFQGDRYVGVCNRWTGYVSAGLPLLIDAHWSFMVDLVDRFGAGIVVDRIDPDGIAEAVRRADWRAQAAGTRALRRHLLDWNRNSFDKLAGVADAALTQRGD